MGILQQVEKVIEEITRVREVFSSHCYAFG
jgi:hypothetical protein